MNATATQTVATASVTDEDLKVSLANKMIAAQAESTRINKAKKTADEDRKEISIDLFGTYKQEGVKDPVVTSGLMVEGDTITLGEVTYVADSKPTTGVSYQALLEHVATRLWQGNPPKWFTDAEKVYVNKGKTFMLKEQK